MAEWARRVFEAFRRLVTETDTTIAEFAGSLSLLSLGVWLIWPFSPDTFEAVPVYRHLGHLAAEPLWGIAALGLAGFQTAANLSRSRPSRRAAALAASAFFGFISVLAYFGLHASLIVPLCASAAFIQGLIVLHLRRPPGPKPKGKR